MTAVLVVIAVGYATGAAAVFYESFDYPPHPEHGTPGAFMRGATCLFWPYMVRPRFIVLYVICVFMAVAVSL